MAKENQFVEQIADINADFPQWYTDVVLKTKLVEKIAPVISWTGITLAVAVVAFFMIYPTGVFISKVIAYAKCFFLKL